METSLYDSIFFLWGVSIALLNACLIFFSNEDRNELLDLYQDCSTFHSIYGFYFKKIDLEGLKFTGWMSMIVALLFSFLFLRIRMPEDLSHLNILIVSGNMILMFLVGIYFLEKARKYKLGKLRQLNFFINIAAFLAAAPKPYRYISSLYLLTLHIVLIYKIIS